MLQALLFMDKELVPLSWTTLDVLVLRPPCLIVPMLECVFTTVLTLRMLELFVEVILGSTVTVQQIITISLS